MYIQKYNEFHQFNEEKFVKCLSPLNEIENFTNEDIKEINESLLGLELFITGFLALPKIMMVAGALINLLKKWFTEDEIRPSKTAKWLVMQGHKLESKYIGVIKFLLKKFKKKMFIDPTYGGIDEEKLDNYARGAFFALLAFSAISAGMTTMEAISKAAALKGVSTAVQKGATETLIGNIRIDDILAGVDAASNI